MSVASIHCLLIRQTVFCATRQRTWTKSACSTSCRRPLRCTYLPVADDVGDSACRNTARTRRNNRTSLSDRLDHTAHGCHPTVGVVDLVWTSAYYTPQTDASASLQKSACSSAQRQFSVVRRCSAHIRRRPILARRSKSASLSVCRCAVATGRRTRRPISLLYLSSVFLLVSPA